MRAPLRFAASAFVAALSGVALWMGCSVYDRSLLVDGVVVDDEGGADGGTHDADLPPDLCAHARWPARPPADTPGAKADVAFVSALRRISIGAAADGGGPPARGADLDLACTCTTGPGSCIPKARTDVCDDDAGRDNSGAELFRGLARRSSILFSEESINDRIEKGETGLLLQVREYNGLADDRQVLVSIYPTTGVEEGDAAAPARWDGNDRWSRDPSGLVGGVVDQQTGEGVPKYVDLNAYVAGGVLVAALDFPVSLGGSRQNSIVVALTGGMIFAPLKKQSRGGYRIEEGQMVGRWKTGDLLTGLQVFRDPLDDTKSLCRDNPTYLVVRGIICDAVDITSDLALDGKGAPCDALSIGIGFAGQPAKIGGVRAPNAPEPPGCGEGWSDSCTK